MPSKDPDRATKMKLKPPAPPTMKKRWNPETRTVDYVRKSDAELLRDA